MVIIESTLTAPPSEVCLFRDITLFSRIFLQENVVLECEKEEIDFYYKWLKDKAAWDYVEDFIKPNTETGFSIRKKNANICVEKIIYENFNLIIQALMV